MDNADLEKCVDLYFDKVFHDEYRPSKVETFEAFKKKKQQIMNAEMGEIVKELFTGCFFFSLIEPENERIKNLLFKFLSFQDLTALNLSGKDAESIAQSMLDQNVFGLEANDVDPLMRIADEVYKLKEFPAASCMYHTLTILFPTHLEGWLKWGNSLFQHDFDYQKTVNIYSECLKLFQHPRVYLSIALCHVKGNHPELAKTYLDKAIASCDQFHESELKERAQQLLKELEALALK